VKKQIAAGKLKPGDSLPSVEQLAAAHLSPLPRGGALPAHGRR